MDHRQCSPQGLIITCHRSLPLSDRCFPRDGHFEIGQIPLSCRSDLCMIKDVIIRERAVEQVALKRMWSPLSRLR
jgi:hypothetical protein